MDRARIESRLKLHIANVALAAVGKKEGDLRLAKDALICEVERILADDRPSEVIIREDRSEWDR